MAFTTTRTSVSTNTYTSAAFTQPVQCNWMDLIYTSGATAGNRQIKVELYNAAAEQVWGCAAGAVQAASITNHYLWMPGTYRETAFIANSIQIPFPDKMIIPANYYFKVYDSANISGTDSMIINIQHSLYGVA